MKKNGRQGIHLYRRLLQVTQKYWQAFLLGILATLVLSLTDAGIAWLIKPIVNKGFIDRDHLFIRLLPMIILAVFVVRSVSGFCSNYFIARVARSVVMNFRQQLFQHLLRLPVHFFDQNPSGKILATLLYNVEQMAQASSDVLVTVLRESSLAIGLVVVMFVINWKLSLIFVLVVPVIAWGLRISSRRLRRLASRVQTSVAEVSHRVSEVLDGHRVVRIFSGESYETTKFNEATKANRQQELKVEVTNSMGTAVTQLLISFPLAIILYFATSPSLGINAGDFAAIISAVMMLVRPLRRVTELNNFVQKGLSGAESIFALLDESVEKDQGTCSLSRASGAIEFKHVAFSYPGSDRPVLSQINFSVAQGKTVAIVGPSGSGKSTLIGLLPRFYELTSGQILLDGIDIRTIRLKELRQQFSLVSQQTVLFNDTVARNIAYAEGVAIDYPRLIEAATLAHAMEFITELPKGFETPVGQDGLLLSGGQRQRIAIARALYKQAPILILDEATSALDTQSERLIQSALAELMGRCTTLVIAHRLSTIEDADWILVMESGKIVAQGTHETLLAQGGVYATWHHLQFDTRPQEDFIQ